MGLSKMTSHKPISDAPVISTVTGIVTILAIPVLMYLLFSVWPDSLARQVVATAAICCMIAFILIRSKYEALLLALIFFSQFQVSLHSFDLDQPVKLQILLSDVIIFLFALVAIERRQSMRLDKIGWLFLLLVGWFAVATFYSAHPHQSLIFLFWQIKFLILYGLARNAKLSDSLVWRIVYTVVCIILIQSSIALVQLIKGGWLGLDILGEPSGTANFSQLIVKGNLRFAGTIGGTNGFAGYMAMLSVLLFPFFLIRNSLLLYSGFGIGTIAILLALSRAGWLSFLVGCVCVIFMVVHARLIKFTRIMLFSFLAGIIFVVGIAIYSDKIRSRFEDKEAISSATSRIGQFYWAENVIRRNLVIGIGPGVTDFFGSWNNNLVFVQKALPGVHMPNQVHNSYLQVCIESGIPGLLIFLAINGAVLLAVLRKVKSDLEADSVMLLRIGGTCAAVSVVVDVSFGNEFNSQQIFLVFWTLLGLARGKLIVDQRDV